MMHGTHNVIKDNFILFIFTKLIYINSMYVYIYTTHIHNAQKYIDLHPPRELKTVRLTTITTTRVFVTQKPFSLFRLNLTRFP